FALYPTDKGIYLGAAKFYAKAGRDDEAEKVLKAAQEKSPRDPDPSLELTDFYLSRGRQEDARRLLAGLKTQFASSIPLAKASARVFRRAEPERSRREIEQILKADSHDPEGYMLQGELHFQAGRYDQARASLEQALLWNSKSPEVPL